MTRKQLNKNYSNLSIKYDKLVNKMDQIVKSFDKWYIDKPLKY